MEIEVLQQDKYPGLDGFPAEKIARLISAELNLEKGYIALIFSPDNTMKALHSRYFDEDTATDVIAFNLEEESIDAEIYIGAEQAKRQSSVYGISLGEEVARLIIHGLLHLKGFTDEKDADRNIMKAEEEKYLGCIKKVVLGTGT
jgi:rRNA maturation RNase YbeY